MPLPTLPLDVWVRISTYLAPAELSSISQVNKELYRIATNEAHFHHHVPVPENKFKHPATLYRRERALLHPPDHFVSRQMSSCIAMLCAFNANLLLVDVSRSRLIVVPNGLSINVQALIGEAGNPFCLGVYYACMARNTVILPENNVAFVTGTNFTRITILNVKSGLIRTHYTGGKRDIRFPIAHGKSVAAAGSDATYLMYYCDRNTIVLFDWRKGSIAKRVRNFRKSIRGRMVGYMMGECPNIDGMSVLGYVVEKPNEDASRKIVSAIGFDDVIEVFGVHMGFNVSCVMKSMDKKTSVLLSVSGSPGYKVTGFIARRKHTDSRQTDYSDRLSMETWPELQDNGRALVAKCRQLRISRSNIRDPSGTRMQRTAVLQDNGIVKRTSVPKLKNRAPPIWTKRTSHGLLALMEENVMGWVELVKVVEDGSGWKETQLKRWYIQGLQDMCVVDDHFIFATSLDGKLHVLHFDRFCNGGRGLYACPLLAQTESHDTVAASPPRKKTRILY